VQTGAGAIRCGERRQISSNLEEMSDATPEIVVTEVTPIVAPSPATAPSEATPATSPSSVDLANVLERLERLEKKAAEVKAVSCSCWLFGRSKKAEASAGAGSA
jgi:hypothetical protein